MLYVYYNTIEYKNIKNYGKTCVLINYIINTPFTHLYTQTNLLQTMIKSTLANYVVKLSKDRSVENYNTKNSVRFA